jgi:hypothetical protein
MADFGLRERQVRQSDEPQRALSVRGAGVDLLSKAEYRHGLRPDNMSKVNRSKTA